MNIVPTFEKTALQWKESRDDAVKLSRVGTTATGENSKIGEANRCVEIGVPYVHMWLMMNRSTFAPNGDLSAVNQCDSNAQRKKGAQERNQLGKSLHFRAPRETARHPFNMASILLQPRHNAAIDARVWPNEPKLKRVVCYCQSRHSNVTLRRSTPQYAPPLSGWFSRISTRIRLRAS